jgi:hypothetical protein
VRRLTHAFDYISVQKIKTVFFKQIFIYYLAIRPCRRVTAHGVYNRTTFYRTEILYFRQTKFYNCHTLFGVTYGEVPVGRKADFGEMGFFFYIFNVSPTTFFITPCNKANFFAHFNGALFNFV